MTLAWMLLILSILIQIVAEITVKDYSLSGSMGMAIVTLVLNTIASILWMAYMRYHSSLVVGAGIWTVSISLAALAIGVLMYHEIVSPQQYIGFGLGVIALFLLI